MSPRPFAQSATSFIESRYWTQADPNRPSWSASSELTTPGRRTVRPSSKRPRRCQRMKSRIGADTESSSGNAAATLRSTARSASRNTRCQVSCALWWLGPASRTACLRSSWWTWRKRRVALRLASRFVADTGPVRGVPRRGNWIRRSSHTPRHATGSIASRMSANHSLPSSAVRSASDSRSPTSSLTASRIPRNVRNSRYRPTRISHPGSDRWWPPPAMSLTSARV